MTSRLNISIQTKELAYALSFASSIVEKRNVLTELSNIKLTARDTKLEIGATDMDLYLNQEISAKVISEGETTVAAQVLTDIIRKIPDEYIDIIQSDDGNELHINGKNCKFKLLTLPATNFPSMESLETNSELKIPCQDLLKLIETTSFSISNDETRYNLNGIYLQLKQDMLHSASTDGHRLSAASIATTDSNHQEMGVIIPKKTIIELGKLIRDSKNIKSDIILHFSTTKIKFKCNNMVLISKLIDGTFPEYSALIPKDNENKLVISTKLLADAIDRIATITVEKFRAIKFFIEQDHLTINATGEAKGMGSEILYYNEDKKIGYSGENLSIGFNPKYWSDVLSVIGEEYIEISLKNLSAPVLVTGASNKDYYFVIMPVKI